MTWLLTSFKNAEQYPGGALGGASAPAEAASGAAHLSEEQHQPLKAVEGVEKSFVPSLNSSWFL